MEKHKYNERSVDIILTPSDVESAVRQFICTCYPEYARDWVLNPKYNVGSVVFAGTKVETIQIQGTLAGDTIILGKR